MNGTIEFGVIVSFILYVRLFTSPLTQMAQGMTNMQTASASAHRIFDFLESEEMPDESEKTAKLTDVRGRVCFDHVRFSYPSDPDKIIIRDFSPRCSRTEGRHRRPDRCRARQRWSIFSCGSLRSTAAA